MSAATERAPFRLCDPDATSNTWGRVNSKAGGGGAGPAGPDVTPGLGARPACLNGVPWPVALPWPVATRPTVSPNNPSWTTVMTIWRERSDTWGTRKAG